MNFLHTLLGLMILASPACFKRPPSYESQFKDVITIDFPAEQTGYDIQSIKPRIDDNLRASGTGFFSGVLGTGRTIDFISIDTDFDLVDEEALVQGFIEDGTLPKGCKATYDTDAYQTKSP